MALAGGFDEECAVSEHAAGVLQIGSGVMTTILKRAADRGEVRRNISPRIAVLPIDLFRKELFLTRGGPEAVTT
jgi:hypothetical protein